MADEDFSPGTHRFAEARYFDDFRVGERFLRKLEPGRTTGVVAMRVAIHYQDKESMMDGLHRYLLRRKP